MAEEDRKLEIENTVDESKTDDDSTIPSIPHTQEHMEIYAMNTLGELRADKITAREELVNARNSLKEKLAAVPDQIGNTGPTIQSIEALLSSEDTLYKAQEEFREANSDLENVSIYEGIVTKIDDNVEPEDPDSAKDISEKTERLDAARSHLSEAEAKVIENQNQFTQSLKSIRPVLKSNPDLLRAVTDVRDKERNLNNIEKNIDFNDSMRQKAFKERPASGLFGNSSMNAETEPENDDVSKPKPKIRRRSLIEILRGKRESIVNNQRKPRSGMWKRLSRGSTSGEEALKRSSIDSSNPEEAPPVPPRPSRPSSPGPSEDSIYEVPAIAKTAGADTDPVYAVPGLVRAADVLGAVNRAREKFKAGIASLPKGPENPGPEITEEAMAKRASLPKIQRSQSLPGGQEPVYQDIKGVLDGIPRANSEPATTKAVKNPGPEIPKKAMAKRGSLPRLPSPDIHGEPPSTTGGALAIVREELEALALKSSNGGPQENKQGRSPKRLTLL